MTDGTTGNGGAAGEAFRRVVRIVGDEDGPAVVALLADPGDPEASREQAARLCDEVAARRRIVVANLAGAASGLDDHLGAGVEGGVEGIRAGRLKLSEAPVQVEGRRFLYLPAGPPPADGPGAGGEAAPPLADPGVAEALETLAAKIREAGGALLLYVTPDGLPDRRATDLVDGAVRLAGAVGVAGVKTLGRLDPDRGGPDESVETFLGLPEDPEDAAGTGDREPAGGEPTRERPASGSTAEEVPADGESGPGPEPAGAAEGSEAAGAAGTWSYAEEEAEAPGRTAAGAGQSPAGTGGDDADHGGAGEERRGPIILGDGGEGGEDGSGWRRHRRSAGLPVGRILLGAVLAAALAGGWWYLAERSLPWAAAGGGPEAGAAEIGAPAADAAGEDGGAAADAGVGREGAAPGGDAVPADTGGDAGPAAAAAVEAAPELPLSVLVASYDSRSAARERLDRWSGEEGAPLLFAAPTPVRDRLYWRVFAGALADREAAASLNRDLVRRGWKEEATAWEVRPAPLAFRLAVEPARAAADVRVSELRGRDVPAYALPASAGGDTVWGIWAGAFETREAAAFLGRSLRERGIRAELTTRRGSAGGP